MKINITNLLIPAKQEFIFIASPLYRNHKKFSEIIIRGLFNVLVIKNYSIGITAFNLKNNATGPFVYRAIAGCTYEIKLFKGIITTIVDSFNCRS